MGSSASSQWTAQSIGDSVLAKHVIVTGSSSGIGLETARELAIRGAHVTMAVRNVAKSSPLRDGIQAQLTDNQGSILVEVLDLEDLDSVRAFAKRYRANHTSLDLLVNNAGILNLNNSAKTKQGFDQQMGTNHLGHFVLTLELLPLLAATPGSRVVNVSSMMHKSVKSAEIMQRAELSSLPRDSGFDVYSRSKLANLLFTFELNRRLQSAGLTSPIVVAAHPGYTETNIQFVDKGVLFRAMMATTNFLFAQDAHHGALPTLRACVDPSTKAGDYYGPNGFKEVKGYPVLVQATDLAHDGELGSWLWERSSTLTGTVADSIISEVQAGRRS